MTFWDYKTGVPFQTLEDIPQPGSLDAEAGVFCSTFDVTGTRLITGGADKTIKVRLHTFPRMSLSADTFCKGIRGTSPVVHVLVAFHCRCSSLPSDNVITIVPHTLMLRLECAIFVVDFSI